MSPFTSDICGVTTHGGRLAGAPPTRWPLPLTSHKLCQPGSTRPQVGEGAASKKRREALQIGTIGTPHALVLLDRVGARSVDVHGRGRVLISRQTKSHRDGRQETKTSR